ncbi:MAG: amidophosphoribosyltransferase [Oscillospiraceae bacterium]|jgi:amidophosphoribosyltransferase|nr:amidophosphoribosyltransferase [Oscillospiraceae bacterium]
MLLTQETKLEKEPKSGTGSPHNVLFADTLAHDVKADKLHEECGVFAIFAKKGVAVAQAAYHGLIALQHRGQESSGIVVNDCGLIDYHKGMGLVSEVFNKDVLKKLQGQAAIGHVRYSTSGGSVNENTQPLVMRYIKGVLAIAHNGNLTNAMELRQELEHRGAIFQTTIDSEVIAYLIARERINSHNIETAIQRAMTQLKGAYSLVVMSPRKIIAARDPKGFRPLCMGKTEDGAIVFASESCALDACGAEFVRDVEPGEIVICNEKGTRSIKANCGETAAHCIFEYIYFARSDSTIDGISVYESRKAAGMELAKQHPVDADLVIGVPESGLDAAIGYAEQSGIPYEKGLVKNSYIGRTFIQPEQNQRTSAVRLKLNALRSVVAGKRIVMLDDSIVRGTTMRRIVTMLRDSGATEVHLRISSPEFCWPCFYGTDIPSKEELIANNYTVEQIAEMLDADSLGFLNKNSLDSLLCGREIPYCSACFCGEYPDGIITKFMSKDDKYL